MLYGLVVLTIGVTSSHEQDHDGVCEHQTFGDDPDAPPVPCCLAQASGDLISTLLPGLLPRLRTKSRAGPAISDIDAAGRGPFPPTSMPHCPSGRLGGGVAAPRCCAVLALTQPPSAKGLYASTRCPAETATLIKIRVFFAGYHTYI